MPNVKARKIVETASHLPLLRGQRNVAKSTGAEQMSYVKFRGVKPGTVLALTEVIGTISFAVGAVCTVLGAFARIEAFLFGIAALSSGLAKLLGVILVKSLLRIAESNDRIVLELENL